MYQKIAVREIQLDEFWGFVFKKQYNLSEAEAFDETIGDIWTFTAFMPEEKLILGHFTGKRTKLNALKLVSQVKARSKPIEKSLFITSDGNDDYTDAIAASYGRLNAAGELELPENLCYAQVVKKIEKGKCKAVTRKLVFGSNELLQECLSESTVSHQINTAYVERSNLAVRQHNHRVERKTQGYSKVCQYLKGHNALSIAYYNLCLPHSSLLAHQGGKPIPTTPAMAAKITNHSWTMCELLSANAFL